VKQIGYFDLYLSMQPVSIITKGGRHGHDRMVVGFTTTCAISAYQY
jgi:hypothetical protein